MKKDLFKFQGIYYTSSGIWPVVHLPSFMAVTGPKTDIWLVQMVGLLSAAIGISLWIYNRKKPFLLAVTVATSYAFIDVVYTLKNVISPVYLIDAGVQMTFLILLLVVWKKDRRKL